MLEAVVFLIGESYRGIVAVNLVTFNVSQSLSFGFFWSLMISAEILSLSFFTGVETWDDYFEELNFLTGEEQLFSKAVDSDFYSRRF